MTAIKNIIFDLGGVLLDIDFNKSVVAFEKLGIANFQEMFSQAKADAVFESLEKGEMGEPGFYNAIKKRTSLDATDEEIAAAWNALISNFRIKSLEFLEELSAKYKLYLLSNTNSIHLKYFRRSFVEETGKPLLDAYFRKTWYSHELGLRKPNKDIFEFVLQEENLVAEETLFIDDTLENIKTAKSMGFQVHHLLPGEKIEDIIK